MVRITDADGVTCTGYSYTIGTGGSAVIEFLNIDLVPRLLGCEANNIEKIWRDLFFYVHATCPFRKPYPESFWAGRGIG